MTGNKPLLHDLIKNDYNYRKLIPQLQKRNRLSVANTVSFITSCDNQEWERGSTTSSENNLIFAKEADDFIL